MNYFEVQERLGVLQRFRKLYIDYISFTNRFENPAAQIVSRQMRPLVPMAIDSLRRVQIGTIVTHDAPARGAKKYRINIIKAIFRESISRNFSLDDQAPLEAVEAAIAKYRVLRSRRLIQLYNPFFWLVQFIGYGAEMPLYLLKKAGFDVSAFRKNAGGKFLKLTMVIFIIYVIVEGTGFRSWLWRLFGIDT